MHFIVACEFTAICINSESEILPSVAFCIYIQNGAVAVREDNNKS